MKLYPTQAPIEPSTQELDVRRHEVVRRAIEFGTGHPVLTILLVSLMAVVINAYPIIFSGKSHVSPDGGMAMVYDWWPPLPGMDASTPVFSHGSDTAAALIWSVPIGFMQSRSVLEHGQLPLWNRYSHAGDTLIGQAISMLGDPLHLIVIFGHGSAWAWDIKFLAAKFLFCAGFGLLILRLFGSLGMALIFAAMGAYCGAYFFNNTHPGFFVLSYSPWILLSAMGFLDVRSGRHVWWGIVWLVVNFGCFNAGHVEAGVLLIAGLNFAALAHALIVQHARSDCVMIMSRIAVGTLLFLGLTAPVWVTFLGALEGSYSVHSEVRVSQLPVASLLGVFDDLFYLLPLKDDTYSAVAPGTSLLVAVGCALSVAGWLRLKAEPFFWVNSAAVLFWGGCVFGWVPASAVELVPLVNRIGYFFRDCSFVLAVHLTLQCAFGFKWLAEEAQFKRAMTGLLLAAIILGGVFLMYHAGITHRPIPMVYFNCAVAGAFGAPLLFAFLRRNGRQVVAWGWAGIIVLGFLPHVRFGLYTFGDQKFLRIPGPRVVLDAPSEAVEMIKADVSEPFRVVGVRRIFFGDYSAVYGLEDIRSCAPLSNDSLIQLVRDFPGMKFGDGWVIEVANPVTAQPLLNLLNVKYLLTPPDVVLQEGLSFRIAGRGDLGVLENLQAWPRAFFTDGVVSIASNEEFVNYLRGHGNQPFAALTPEEMNRHPGMKTLTTNQNASVTTASNYLLLPNSTAFDIRATSAGIVCLTEGQARDFVVRVNNEPKPVLTVNRAFKGVYLDRAGDHRIEFLYQPRHWRLSCALFWAAITSVVAIVAARGLRAWRQDAATST